MKTWLIPLTLALGLCATGGAHAAKPAASAVAAASPAPPGSTGLCKDGSYTDAAVKKGACKGHKGVKDWFGAAAATATTAAVAKPAAPAAVTPPPAKPMAAAAPAMASKPAPATAALPATPAPGGGPGQVWVNSDSKVYHCAGSKYYGKTKKGEYMTEAAAKAAGDRADHGKACSAG